MVVRAYIVVRNPGCETQQQTTPRHIETEQNKTQAMKLICSSVVSCCGSFVIGCVVAAKKRSRSVPRMMDGCGKNGERERKRQERSTRFSGTVLTTVVVL